ncbi:DUF4748 domain-containing protein [Boleophthalmus pectinirostris]|uniref:DUF4748 domain-containing protein n=1 Tax=Boleophthalmus pectinirostris TaxID=150288 RepID=UPI00242E471F|nr:DUF4748 domain-containing protein [Boleophthalmus pectinirostris]
MCSLINMAAFRTALTRISWKDVHFAPVRSLLTHSALCSGLSAAHRRPLDVPPASSMCSSSRPVQQSSPPKQNPKVTVHEEEEEEGPEYIPKRKAKNPMMKIGYAWMIGLPTGILTFILAKRQVDKNRLKQLKIRQRMRQSNEGEFDGSRYQRHTGS